MKPDEAAAALLHLIAENRDATCRGLRAAARDEARAALAQAHADARKRVRSALEAARNRAGERVGRAQVRLRTRQRLAAQGRMKACLRKAAALARERLVQSWNDAVERREWAERAARRASALLPAADWEVAHPVDWPGSERERLREALAARARGVRFTPDPAIAAGLRLTCADTVFDATAEGLLADGEAIEARLLFHLEALAP
jgi:hypothetical protein